MKTILSGTGRTKLTKEKAHMAELVRIGNSKGIRIPKIIIDQARLKEKKLEFKIVDEGLLICPVSKKTRVGWEEIFIGRSSCR